MMDGTITLIKIVYQKDEIGQDIPQESEREVMCEFKGITRNEWLSAGQNNINASVMVVMPYINYDGEKIAIVNGARKAIYRTYTPPDSDDIELYMRDEAGVL